MLAVPKVLSTARGLRTRIERKDVEGFYLWTVQSGEGRHGDIIPHAKSEYSPPTLISSIRF